ncbi:PREDICTED: cytochrome P450 87A3-like isoform X1 [Ipomoea nil]|uniref:cytochrome P450 87A3-like isoform X1 n=1 Tax=Ipomoea nil TaxID=35883 RepID=UPI0009011DD8|nr:PREDICTED: cytochrome P450 87A3-like isoform X1 [Ipomoea nil]
METMFSSSMDELRKMNVSAIVYSVSAMLSIYIAHWIYRWRNPKCNGVLPPGSMGLPFIGETLQLIIPSHDLALPPFINTRIKRYGSMFKTSVAGRPVIISADTDFNSLILKQDGKMVETWSMDTFAQVFENQEMQSSMKYIRHLVLNHFGVEALKEKLLPQIETFINHTLHKWSTQQDSVEVKSAAITAAIDFAANELFSGDLENAPFSISDMYRDLVEGLMSFPINLPGTAHHKCLQIHKKVRGAMRDVVKKRFETPERQQEDVLDHMIRDMGTHKFLSEDFIVQLMFGLLFVASESISTTLALAFKLLAEHPNVLEELTAEHDTILKNRENPDAPLTWNEYKSMTFTLQVINEVLRLGNIAPGLFRRAIKDIPYNGYTIPSGWVILIATAALHLNSDEYEDPLAFNPWRWQKIQQNSANKHFMPFGSGMKQCAGAEYSRLFLATFLHNLVTNYKWKMVKGGKIVRAPIIRFPDGFHFHISKKN